jgi:hypothetical protein
MTRAESATLGRAASARSLRIQREEGLVFARAWRARHRSPPSAEPARAVPMTTPYPFRDHLSMAEV